MFIRKVISLGITVAISGVPISVMSADVEEVIVTGVAQPTTVLESTNSVTSLSTEEISNYAPRSTAEIFRNIPGVQSESTSGDSNANIKVRGLPISAGGSRYLSIQEDGHPMLLIGDMDFATADSFLRLDKHVKTVQSIRGGSSSTFAANSAGGIINFISKTGEVEGGSIGLTGGIDFDSNRADFDYGKPLGNGWSFHIAGFGRKGEGPRDVPDDIETGVQVRANITKKLDKGFVRIHLKHLDDRSPTYLPIPAKYNGDDFNEVGVDFGDGTLYLEGSDLINRSGGRERASLTTGFESKFDSFGFELEYDLTDATTIGINHRTAFIAGQFVSPFPATANANGDVNIHYFNTKLDSLDNNFVNGSLEHDFGRVTAKAGVSYATQDYDVQWGWNQYDVNLNTFNAATWERIAGHPIWGGCCQRDYDFQIENMAPYFALTGYLGDKISWDASVRQDFYTVDGTYSGAAGANDADGFPLHAEHTPVDYDFNYTSASIGVNYLLNDNSALFANASMGGSAISPSRILTNNNITPTGGLKDDEVGYTDVKQLEGGYKFERDNLSAYVTIFYTETDERGAFDVAAQNTPQNSYESKGLELEADYNFGYGFRVRGSFTYTDAEITKSNAAANVGNTPRRQADYIFNVTPTYTKADHLVGLNFVGTDEVFVQDNNALSFDSYIVTNLFWNYSPKFVDGLNLSLNINNLLDEEGFTEGEEDPVVVGNVFRIRPINGRTAALTLRYDF